MTIQSTRLDWICELRELDGLIGEAGGRRRFSRPLLAPVMVVGAGGRVKLEQLSRFNEPAVN